MIRSIELLPAALEDLLKKVIVNVKGIVEKVSIDPKEVAIDVAIGQLNASRGIIDKALAVYAQMGTDTVFGRSDVASITYDSVTAAGNLINKLKGVGLLEAVSGFGKGKYRFVNPQ